LENQNQKNVILEVPYIEKVSDMKGLEQRVDFVFSSYLDEIMQQRTIHGWKLVDICRCDSFLEGDYLLIFEQFMRCMKLEQRVDFVFKSDVKKMMEKRCLEGWEFVSLCPCVFLLEGDYVLIFKRETEYHCFGPGPH
jgi:hypothetical protein